ncbi:MAG TPA: N-acetyl-alpha-D-glucosaminyl L-malate synthase BshA [Bacillota bacterium]|nr:N-acetyl-alpha-D-glucosaminyl L-malate synthase BshA [Bacillota bacterium]
MTTANTPAPDSGPQGPHHAGRPLRVALVCHPTQGGSGVLATELARELGRRGSYAHVISYQPPLRLRRFPPNVYFHEVDIPSHPLLVHAPYEMALASKIADVARYEGVEIVHVHYAVPHAFAAVVAAAMVAPAPLRVVATLHGTDVTQLGQDESVAAALAWSLRHCDAVTAVSSSLASLAQERFGLAAVRVVPNFIDPATMRPRHDLALRASLAEPGDLVLLHASNFRPVKRIPDVIRIFAAVAAARPAVLLLLGDGPDAAAAHRLSHELGVADRVRFLGVHEDVAPLLSVADLFLLPSETESFGLAALEAMACEVPVVATRVGGLPEVIEDGKSGILCAPGDVAAMAAACLRLGDAAVHGAMATEARRRAVTHFSASRVVPQYEALYREVLGAV